LSASGDDLERTMSERQHYPKAPIVEALIDLRVTLPDDVTIDRLRDFATSLQDHFPVCNDLKEIPSNLEIQADGSIQATAPQIGYRLSNPDSNQVVMARLNGLTVSLFAPYSQWEDLRDTAGEVWDAYKIVCHPVNVTRIAVRYINRLNLPQTPDNLTDYIQVFPTLPADFPGTKPNDYFMQMVVPQEDLDSLLIVNSGRVPSPSDKLDALSLILDFDLFCDLSAQPWETENDGLIWEFLERLHLRKNEAFEASITDKVRELIR
jgi:uncharacterized protein (TIGR04255 family)